MPGLTFLILSAACTVGLFAICCASLRLADEACCVAAILARMVCGEVGMVTMLVNLQDDKERMR